MRGDWHQLPPTVTITPPEYWPWEKPMSEKKIVVPEGMLKAVQLIAPDRLMPDIHITTVKGVLEAALCWLAKNPIVPTDEQLDELSKIASSDKAPIQDNHNYRRRFVVEWQLRMFLAGTGDLRRQKIIEVLKQYPDRAPEIADKILDALGDAR